METHEQLEQRRKSGILKKSASKELEAQQLLIQQHHHSSDHVHFDEEVIQEHDLDRGTRMKIDEPKTPFNDEVLEDEVSGDAGGTGGSGGSHHTEDVQMHTHTQHVLTKEEEEIKKHLEEAERNKLLNAQLQKEAANKSNLKQFHSELTEKLDKNQASVEEEEHKHQDFIKKRKDHYKNEGNAAVLLKQRLPEDEEEEESDQPKQ